MTVDPPFAELRLLHWNVHSWRDTTGRANMEAVAELIEATEPHVVSLVEVDEVWNQPALVDQLAAALGYSSIFIPTFEFGDANSAGGFGNALLSKLPIQCVRQRQLIWPPRIYDGTEPSEPRSALFAQLQTAQDSVWIGSTHLPLAEAATRTAALQRLIAITAELTEPWLLLGDFNTPAASWLHQHPTLRAHPTAATPTYPADNPTEARDYCIAPNSQTIEADTLHQSGSDHLPILARWRQSPVAATQPATNP